VPIGCWTATTAKAAKTCTLFPWMLHYIMARKKFRPLPICAGMEFPRLICLSALHVEKINHRPGSTTFSCKARYANFKLREKFFPLPITQPLSNISSKPLNAIALMSMEQGIQF
jgi:hypothetical protein